MREITLDIDNPEEIARIIGMYVNNFSWGGTQEKFIKAILSEHRTLQQSVLELFINTIIAAAEQYNLERYDMRCAASYQMCEEMRRSIQLQIFEGKIHFPCI